MFEFFNVGGLLKTLRSLSIFGFGMLLFLAVAGCHKLRPTVQLSEDVKKYIDQSYSRTGASGCGDVANLLKRISELEEQVTKLAQLEKVSRVSAEKGRKEFKSKRRQLSAADRLKSMRQRELARLKIELVPLCAKAGGAK